MLKHGKWYLNKPRALLFFEAVTLCHVRLLSRSDAQVARTDSWAWAWGSCGIVFYSSLRQERWAFEAVTEALRINDYAGTFISHVAF